MVDQPLFNVRKDIVLMFDVREEFQNKREAQAAIKAKPPNGAGSAQSRLSIKAVV
jgi:hypothetical protein